VAGVWISLVLSGMLTAHHDGGGRMPAAGSTGGAGCLLPKLWRLGKGHNPLKRLIFILCMLVLLGIGIGVAGLIVWPTIVTLANYFDRGY
jgi:hypothetical protein